MYTKVIWVMYFYMILFISIHLEKHACMEMYVQSVLNQAYSIFRITYVICQEFPAFVIDIYI